MSHPLIQRLFDEFGYAEISLENHDAFIATPGLNVLFFPGDPAVAKDSTDVAVVLPELVAAFDGRLSAGVDWADYLDRIGGFFAAPAQRPPGFSIPVVSA